MDNQKEIEKIAEDYAGHLPYGKEICSIAIKNANDDNKLFLRSEVEKAKLEAKGECLIELLTELEEDAMRYPHRKIPKWVERTIIDNKTELETKLQELK